MNEKFININVVPTHVFTWGIDVDERFTKKELILCITGNPGLAGFYTKFLSTIHEQLGKDIPVWILSKFSFFSSI